MRQRIKNTRQILHNYVYRSRFSRLLPVIVQVGIPKAMFSQYIGLCEGESPCLKRFLYIENLNDRDKVIICGKSILIS